MKTKILSLIALVSISLSGLSQTATGVVTQIPCNDNGIFTVSTTGIPLPITYTYYTNGTSEIHSNVNSATDQLTNMGMNGNGYVYCQVTSGGISIYAQGSYSPSFNFETVSTNPICPATMGTLTATQINGTPGPFTYSWTNNLTLTSYTGNNAAVPIGNYSAIITDVTTGCILHVSDTSIAVQQSSSIIATISSTQANCTNGTATVIASGGVAPYSYLWMNGATTSTITGLSQGTYSVIVTDAQGCQSNNIAVYVQQNPNISVNTTVTNSTCVQTDGSALVFGSGGASPYTYAWSNGQTGNNATNLSGGIYYTVIATDANGCTGQSGAYVSSNTPVNVTYTTTPSQCTSATGSATLAITGGTAPYTIVWNTSVSASGVTLSNVAPGSYSFQVTDAVGCVRTGTAVVSPISTINANVQASTVVCPVNTGVATATVSGSNPPFTYLWNTGESTSQITGAALGFHSCVITDDLGCSVTKIASVISTSPINVSVSTTPATCIFSSDGTATVNGGAAPYTFSYTGGITTANATGLAVGNYYLTVTDANNCTSTQYFQIGNSNTSTSCYCTISGHVYLDANTDCNYDAGENGIENIMVHCSSFGYTFTDANGYYSFQVPTGTYTITEQVNAYYPLTACQNTSTSVTVVAASGCNTVVDIANDINIINDLKIVTVNSTLPPIPGNSYQQKVIIKNQGTVTESGIQLGYEHDSQLPFASSTSPNLVQLNSTGAPYAYSIQSGFPTLTPNTTSVMLLNYNTPTDIPLGTTVNFYDTVANIAPIDVNWLLDYTPWNNVNTYQTSVIGSYDPNYKEVSPKGEGVEGYVPMTTTEFDYTIHFQNEGTYYAQNISVTDQLDEDLDWSTLTPGYSDYNYTTTVSETGLVTFTFANIHLPWKSNFGDALSSGLVNYSIKRKSTTPEGTVFTNTANIYFDYNAPITTNTTVNTLNITFSVDEISTTESNAITVDLYPVPAKDVLTIRLNNISQDEVATLSIIDIMGKVVLSDRINLNEGSTAVTQNVSNLETGTYLVKIQTENGPFIIKKIVVFQD